MNRATENITATETHFVQRYVASEKTSSYVESSKFAAKISNKKRESSEAFVSEKLNKYKSSSAFASEKNKNRSSVLDYDKVDALASVFEKHNKKQEVSPNLIPEKGAKRSSSGIFTHSNTSTINSEFLGGAKRSSSGIFSFFKWFKKSDSSKTSSNLSINDNRSESSASSNNDDDASDDGRDVSKSYALSRDTSAGSVDTLFSTATVASFTYVPPTAYKPFGSANVPEKLFQPGPETDTHRNRMKLLDKHRERDKNLTLRKKYRLFTGETSPENKQEFSDYSLPLVKTKSMDDDERLYDDMSKKHRRTVSDSSKDKKAGAYCHVKGKRKAPPPPVGAVRTSVNEQLAKSPNSTLNKKKRPAPPPPVASVKVMSNLFTDLDTKYANPTTNLTQEQKDLLISNISRLQNNRGEESDEENNGNLSSSVPDVVCNDSLKLEHGVLKPLKDVQKPPEEAQSQKIVAPVSPISPRPWYKRTLSSSTSNRDSIISHHFGKKDIVKSKSVEEKIDDNFPMRFSSIKTESKFNMFSRFTSSDDRKENRKSNVSMLANISELDREAAAIVQKEQNREQAKLEAQNEKFYSKIDDEQNEMPEFLRQRTPDSPNKNSSKFKKGSARELISRFNALTNVTKVTVNAALFPNKDESNAKRRFSFSTEQSSTSSRENISVVTPPMKRSIFNAIGYKEPSTPKIVEENLPTHKTEMKLDFEAKAAKQPIDISRFLEIPSPYKPNAPPLTPMDIQIKDTTKLEQQNVKEIELKEEKQSVGSGPGNVLESWICARCTLENERCRMTCLACNAWKPISKITNIDKYLAPSPAQSASHFYGGGVAPVLTKTDDCATAPALEENKTSAEDDKNKSTRVDKNASTTATNVFKEQNKNNATASSETENTSNDKNIQKEARTFAEHVFKQFETNEENNGANEKAVITSVVVIEPDMDEIRRARVARFSQNLDINDNDKTEVKSVEKVIANDNKSEIKNDTVAPTPPNRLMTEEQIKLRKMLKEMKDSLPNKRKSAELRKLVNDKENIHLKLGKEVSAVKDEIAKSDVINMRNNIKESLNIKLNSVCNKNDNENEEKHCLKSEKKENLQTICEVSDSKKNDKETSKGAVPKEPQHKDVADSDRKDHKPIIVKEIPKQKPITQNENKIGESIIIIPKQKTELKTEDKIAEALIITQEITYENIKVKKENLEARKPIKVSSSVQTQAVVRQINSPFQRRKPPTGKSDDIILPITVESQSSSKSVSRCGSFGKGTFELIRPKDFADISATNTRPNSRKNSTSSEGPPHTYANISEINDSSKSTEPPSTISSLNVSPLSPASSEEELLSAKHLWAKLSSPVGLQDFKATLNTEKQNVNTLAINRLLKRLEAAIAGGQHVQAAKLAKDLARLKVNCSVTRQKEISTDQNSFTADMYVEDQVSHQGPIPLKVYSEMTVGELKQKVMQEFDIPAHVQRWILGRQLATDDSATLEEYDVSCKGAPLFLYLVAPDDFTEETLKKPTTSSSQLEKLKNANEPVPSTSKDTHYVTFKQYAANNQSDSDSSGDIDKKVIQNLQVSKKAKVNKEVKKKSTVREMRETSPKPLDPKVGWQCPECTLINQPQRPGCEACAASKPIVQPKNTKTTSLQNYIQLMDLDKTDLVQNTEPFECLVCLSECRAGEGVTLRECLHTFCRQCLANTVEYTDEAEVKCPYRDDRYSCDIVLQQREIKALVSKEVYEQYLARSIAQAENKIDNAFHCKTPDCKGWCIFEDNVNEFKCPVCRTTNCLTCQAIHEGLNCKQYQEQMAQDSETNADARRTREMLNEMVACGEAMACPSCQVVLMKKWGCDWLRCSMCKTEICWVTRGPRWGPGGKGDTSGGCQCGVNGIKCHPKCTYCH